jgi:indoleamine 2,3-dioxygenase
MPLTLADGSPGLLAKGEFGTSVMKELPEYNVDSITDPALLTALFRDYTFAASSYLLEPCDLHMRKHGSYGLGRSVLPRCIAVPLSIIAGKIGVKPFMEYAQSYALYNYQKIDRSVSYAFNYAETIGLFKFEVDKKLSKFFKRDWIYPRPCRDGLSISYC